MKKILILTTCGLFCFFIVGIVFAGVGGSNLTLLETGENYLKVKAEASIITTAQYELKFEDEAENPQPGEYVITLNAFEGESTSPENAISAAFPMTFFLYNPIEGSNTVRIEVNPPGDFSEGVFTTSQEFIFSRSSLPDLTITRLIPQFTASGKKYVIVDVANHGNADVTDSVKVVCGYLNSENNKYKEKKSFSIRKKFMINGYIYTKKIPLNKKSPLFGYQCTIDPTNLIKESNEDNNVSSIESLMSTNSPISTELQTSVLTSPTTDKYTQDDFKCTDSDGGKDYFTKGTAKESVSPLMNYTDMCGPGSSAIPTGHELIEWNCGGNGRVIFEYYNCPNGCKDGACVKESIPTTNNTPISTTDRARNLAKCLTQKGVKFYGAYWCPHCQKQKELFGKEAVKELNYIECYPDGNSDNFSKTCADAKIEAFPTWEFESGKLSPGYLTLEQIAKKTSCSY